jgi:protein-S-isoprenylcysteine O-methyltransferase Ste14
MDLPANDLNRRALIRQALFLLVLAALLFLPAGTLRFWQGWVYWVMFAVLGFSVTLYFLKHDPKLVERRMAAGPGAEKETTQKIIITVALACFFAIYIVSGIDYRLHGPSLPWPLVLLADLGVALGYIAVFFVLKQNTYAAATVQVETGQAVVSSGFYRFVRHPMYTAGLLMLGVTPAALGSVWGLLTIVPILGGVVWRLLDEEKYLTRNLSGYADYCRQARYRLIPGIW